MNPAAIIPVYNHSLQIVEVIQNVRLCGRPIFVVDDGFTDSAWGILQSLNGISLVRHEKNQNKAERLSHFRPWRDVLKNSSTFSRRIRDRLLSGVRR